mgnify:CR=1 FL=1
MTLENRPLETPAEDDRETEQTGETADPLPAQPSTDYLMLFDD